MDNNASPQRKHEPLPEGHEYFHNFLVVTFQQVHLCGSLYLAHFLV